MTARSRSRRRRRQGATSLSFFIVVFGSQKVLNTFIITASPSNVMVVEAFQLPQHHRAHRRHRLQQQQQRQDNKEMTPITPPPNDFDTDNDNKNDEEYSYKGATLFGLEPKSSSSSSSPNNDDGNNHHPSQQPPLLEGTFGMQYTSIVIFVLSCYVTFMLFFGDDVNNVV